MNNTYSLLKSRTFWMIVAMVVFGGANAVMPIIPAPWNELVQVALGVLASYFHLSTAKSVGATN